MYFVCYYSDNRLPETQTELERTLKELEVAREKKWLDMLPKWEKIRAGKDKKLAEKFRKRVYKGIPDKLRGVVWTRMLNVAKLKQERPGMYEVRGGAGKGGEGRQEIRRQGGGTGNRAGDDCGSSVNLETDV